MTYARGTEVGSDRSRAEIERVVTKFGAHAFVYGWDPDKAMIQFQMRGRIIRFLIPLPDRHDPEFTRTPTGRPRVASASWAAYEAEVRRRWRSLALLVKAKLVAVGENITDFDEEFLPHIVLPGGETVGQWMIPQVEQAYLSGEMPRVLPALGSGQ